MKQMTLKNQKVQDCLKANHVEFFAQQARHASPWKRTMAGIFLRREESRLATKPSRLAP
jgi:hypothetical protein